MLELISFILILLSPPMCEELPDYFICKDGNTVTVSENNYGIPDGFYYRWWKPISKHMPGYCPYNEGDGMWDNELIWPTASSATHEDFIFESSTGYLSIGIESPPGSIVRASADGQVIWAGASGWGDGNLVILAHGNGWRTHYMYLNSVFVSIECGDFIEAGDIIGFVGGSDFGDLRFQLVHDGTPVNPINKLQEQNK